MAGRIKVMPGMKPREVTQILMADAKSKRWEDACNRLFETMPRMRLSPNLYHFNAASFACQRAVAWQSSLKLLDLQTRSRSRPAPDVISYNTTLSACAKAERWPWALYLLRTMKVDANSISYSAATSACEASGRCTGGKFWAQCRCSDAQRQEKASNDG